MDYVYRNTATPAAFVPLPNLQQVPADVVKILRSRAALENELVMENGLPVLIPDSQAAPSSARESSEALMLTKLAPTELEIPQIIMPAPAPDRP